MKSQNECGEIQGCHLCDRKTNKINKTLRIADSALFNVRTGMTKDAASVKSSFNSASSSPLGNASYS